MTTIVTRLYTNAKKAQDVMAALALEGIIERDVDLIAKDSATGTKAARTEALSATISGRGVAEDAAGTYADEVASGRALIVVRAPFGSALRVIQAMDAFDPVETDVENTDVFVSGDGTGEASLALLTRQDRMISEDILPGLTRSATPFSSMTGMRPLSGHGPKAKLLDRQIFGFKPLIASRPKAKLMTDGSSHISGKIGFGLLSGKGPQSSLTKTATPFSSMLGLPLLSK